MSNEAEIDTVVTTADDAADDVKPQTQDDGVIDTATELQADTGEGDSDDDGDELIVSIGDDAPPEEDGSDKELPRWVKRLRRDNYRAVKENQKLKREIEEIRNGIAKPAQQDELGKEPELEDFDYDAPAFRKAHKEWVLKEQQHVARKEAEQKQAQQAQAAWDAKLATYQERKQSLARDADEAEAALLDALSSKWGHQQAQQRLAMLVEAADDPAQLVYALGKIPGRAKELAEIESVVRFVAVASKMESQVKVTKRTPAAAPEKLMTGTAPVGVGGADATLDRLYAEAARTGNMTKVIAYKRQLKRA